MADSPFTVTVRGLADVSAALRGLPPKLRMRAILNALRAGARVFRDEARRLTPVLAVPVRRKGRLIRKPGTVRNAISVRTSKRARRAGDLGVFVNVRPAKGANRGATNPFDPFYWRWLEFGRQARPAKLGRRGSRHRAVFAMRGAGFLRGAVKQAATATARISASLGAAVQRLANRNATP